MRRETVFEKRYAVWKEAHKIFCPATLSRTRSPRACEVPNARGYLVTRPGAIWALLKLPG